MTTGCSESPQGRVRLKRTGGVEGGTLWIYGGDIQAVEGSPAPGDLVDISSTAGRVLARGLYNPHSKIPVRILTHVDEPIDESFWAGRLAAAVALRERVVDTTTAYRVVYGEGDRLPGLIVDRYGDVLVMQALSFGMDRRKDLLARLLLERTGALAVYLRHDAKSRTLESLPLEKRFLSGDTATRVEIREGMAEFVVDVERGQKTGWFCDQRENRAAAAALAKGAEVLEVFCHTGAFGIQAGCHGAVSVLGIDSSREAVNLASHHADINGLRPIASYREADAFDELRALDRAGRRFDLVIVDPPAFARSRHAVPHAVAGYKDVNLRALRLIRPQGFLVSCSCSSHVDEATFRQLILDAARDAKRQLRVIEVRSQARDHPTLAAMPETRYLKCLLLQVL